MNIDPLPIATLGEIIGLLETLGDRPEGKEDVPDIAAEIQFDLDDIFPIIDAAETLRFVVVDEGDIALTSIGSRFLDADINARKAIFKEQLKNLPVYRELIAILKEREDECADRELFVQYFSSHVPSEEAEELVHIAIDWGRFAELIGYNADSEEVYIDHEH